MAATGLLGINPYQKGVAIDISSKPVNLAMQLEQKEAAKREALDKYFMDYEKTLNTNGMRPIDQNLFLGKLGEAKQYYLQNRDKILNPAKYGAEFQSNYNSQLRDAQSIIGESKAQLANDKVVAEHIYQATQNGKTIHDGVLPMIEASHLSIRDPRFRQVDPYALQFDKPHDENVFNKNVWGNLTLPTREVPKTLPNGKVSYTKESYLTTPVINTAVTNALNEYTTNPGTAKHFNELSKNPAIFNSVNDVFGETFKYTDPKTKKEVKPSIQNMDQFVAGYALLKKPTGEISTSKAEYPWLTKFNMQQNRADSRAAMYGGGSGGGGNLFDTIQDLDFKNGKIRNGTASDVLGNPFNGSVYVDKKDLPSEIFSAIGKTADHAKGFDVTFENGTPVKFINPKTGTVTRQGMENYQLKYNTEPGKGRQPYYGKKRKGGDFINLPEDGFNGQ
jgi:hypothetical protein